MTNAERIQANNAELREAIELAENLPKAGDSVEIMLQSKSVTPTDSTQEVTADDGYTALGKVTVGAIPNGGYDRGYAEGYIAGEAQTDTLFAALANRTVEELVIEESVDTIPASFLINCTKLKRFEVNGVRSLGAYAMEKCSALTVLHLPDCQNITSGSLRGCTNLKKVDFGILNSIGGVQALYNNTNLTTFIDRANRVCSLANANSFANTPIESGTGFIYVPDNLVDSYKSATNWSAYASQIRAIEDYPEITGG